MTSSQIILFVLILTLVFDLLLTAAKIGFTNSRIEKLIAIANGDPSAVLAYSLLSERSSLVYYLQTAHVMLRFLLAGLVTAQYLVQVGEAVLILELMGVLLAAGIVTAVLEQIVESRVLPDPESWSIRLSGFTRAFRILFFPIMLIPILAARLLPVRPNRLFRVTEDELNLILDESEAEGVLEVDEREMIKSIFHFRETTVREIMIPRMDLLALGSDTSVIEAIDRMLESGFSRVPVFEDNIDSVVGVLYIKDLLRNYRQDGSPTTITEVVRPAYFVPETKKVGELLTEMQNQRIHIAVVVDEYGGVAGIATLEDIVEEIVGEIEDEYDPAEEQLFQRVSEDEYVFQGKIDINDFNEVMGTDLPKETADTLGGLLYARFGRIPRAGETTGSGDILFTIEQVAGRRIRKVRAMRPHSTEQSVST